MNEFRIEVELSDYEGIGYLPQLPCSNSVPDFVKLGFLLRGLRLKIIVEAPEFM